MLRLPWDYEEALGVDADSQSVAEAVCASAASPFFFRPRALPARPNVAGGDSVLGADGGLLSNFPVDVFDRKEQERWSRAIWVGGLPYMWRRAAPVLEMIYDLLELKEGDKVFLIGESLESCGFVDDLEELVGKTGLVTALDIQEDCRDAFFNNKRGRGGQPDAPARPRHQRAAAVQAEGGGAGKDGRGH